MSKHQVVKLLSIGGLTIMLGSAQLSCQSAQNTNQQASTGNQQSATDNSQGQAMSGQTANQQIAQTPGVNNMNEQTAQASTQQEVTTPTGLKYQDAIVGKGDMPRFGQTVTVHYTGWLTNGTKFDSSVDRGQPFEFQIGTGQVIKGWDEGVSTMRVGGKRRLTIPSDLGYGARGAGGVIPPNSTLVFDVELLGIH
jgi:FKBP-type peptidyl-prolyl cis-trans isomerase